MTTKKPTTRKSTSTRSRKQPAAETAVQDQLPKQESASDEAIAELAHRLYLERGGSHGHDVEDWLEAERRIRNGS